MAKIAEATLVLKVDSKEYTLALNQIPKDAEKAAQAVKGIGQAVDLKVFKEFGTVFASAIKTVVSGIVELGQRGAAVDDVANSFEILTSKTGETADVMLGELRKGVVGTLSDYDLMTLANKTLGSGLVKTADDMGVLAAGARTLAKATGGTTKEAFDTLTSAMASGRTAQLKQLGLFVDSKVAIENYASAIGKNVSQLTDSDRAQALAAASLEALKKRMQEVQPDAADFGELIEQAEVRLGNFKDQVAVAVAKSPVFAAGMKAMGKSLDDAFGSDPKEKVSELTKLMERFVIGLTYVGQGAVVLGYGFVTVFSAMEFVTNGVLQVFYGLGASVLFLVDGLAKLILLTNPGLGFRKLAADVSDLKTHLSEMQKSFADSTTEAGAAVLGQGALHAKLLATDAALVKVRDAMVAAQGKTAETTKAVVDLGQAAPEAAGRSQEAADKIADAFRVLNDEVVAGTKIGLDKRLFEIDAARDKELAGLSKLKEMTAAEHDEMVRLTIEKYAQRTAAAILAGDEIVAKERSVQQEIALSLTTGTANKLLQIQIARDKEIEALAFIKAVNAEQYAADVAAVIEKYRIQSEAAQGYYANVGLAAAAAGFKTREEQQIEANNAKRLYDEMLASGKYSYQQLEEAKKKSTDAQMALDEKQSKFSIDQLQGIAGSASSILRELFGKNKAAAIAATAIDAAAAIVKAFAQGGILGFASAAAIAAATAKQIVTIRNAKPDGFAQGTPGLDFADFGRESFHPLHNQEAVIPRGGGHVLAGEIADSMPGNGEELALQRRTVQLLEDLPREMRRVIQISLLTVRA